MSQAAVRIYVPRDSAALAVGAEALARAIAAEAAARGLAIELVRNGSRGLLWLEPLVEVATPAGRVGYANLDAAQVGALFDAGWLEGGEHPSRVGLVDELPYLKQQQRLTFARIGITDPLSIDDYLAHGGLEGLRRALTLDGAAACEELIESGLRADAAAPRSRPASSGAPCARRRRRRSTWSAMPTRATRAPSPTAWSWRAIPTA